ncbi:Hypothetical predicted protein [Scomber scombrus]|uniref:Uncharacterized protein n=1 Tax=Scomber scombrus TaxID=13677 RepID=A0AAV1QP79_SCOSC
MELIKGARTPGLWFDRTPWEEERRQRSVQSFTECGTSTWRSASTLSWTDMHLVFRACSGGKLHAQEKKPMSSVKSSRFMTSSWWCFPSM